MPKASDNMKIWNSLGKTDPKHTSSFSRAGGFKGTAMKPIWIVKRMTEQFGPVGTGWGMTKPEFEVVPAGKELMVYCTVGVWHEVPDNLFYGVGGDKVIHDRRNGPFNSDEAFKMAYTDAVNNALKYLGVGADIHMGQFDDSKYVREVAEEFTEVPDCVANVRAFKDKIALCTSEDALKEAFETYAADIAEADKTHGVEVKMAKQAYAKKLKALRDAADTKEGAEARQKENA